LIATLERVDRQSGRAIIEADVRERFERRGLNLGPRITSPATQRRTGVRGSNQRQRACIVETVGRIRPGEFEEKPFAVATESRQRLHTPTPMQRRVVQPDHDRFERRRINKVGQGIEGGAPDVAVRVIQAGDDLRCTVPHLKKTKHMNGQSATPPSPASRVPISDGHD
jgi:hypothetical protein